MNELTFIYQFGCTLFVGGSASRKVQHHDPKNIFMGASISELAAFAKDLRIATIQS